MAYHMNDYLVTDADRFVMGKGEWYKSYEKLGAHPCEVFGEQGYFFQVWAPKVESVHVIGDFNGWDEQADLLNPTTASGDIWQGFVRGAKEGDCYKYLITTKDGEKLYKADPYGYWCQVPPETASRLYDLEGYKWKDGRYMANRKRSHHMEKPLNIYEVHLASWRRHADGLEGNGSRPADGVEAGGSFYTYDELSEELVNYVKDMGYSHIEVLPVMEHPFDGSWGYQVTGYYAPTSRYGNPKQFMHFVDACHAAGIGVILDWVPGGFCADAHGLASFNGSMLYEKEIHPDWGTYKFDLTSGEVRSFLASNALYWIDTYHADGLRMDGVTSILYLNFGVDDPSKKKFNEKGTEEDLDAIRFVQQVNSTVADYHPDAMMIAEESTAWPLVTYPPKEGGLGFHYKWDMGWMNDTLHYQQTDFPWRPGNHKLLTFSIMYSFNENFILPLSHDEVVHGKCSLIGRMPGDYWRQFAGLRALAFYQITHPGGKLNFMGNEIGQFIEWRYYEPIQWFMAEQYEAHGKHQHYIAALNKMYNEQPGLWEKAYSADGFEWIDANDADQSFISYVRHGKRPKDDLVVLINWDPATYEEFRIGVPTAGEWTEIFNSDAQEFGGSGVTNGAPVLSEKEPWNGLDNSIVVRVPPLGGAVWKRTGNLPKPPAAKKAPAAKKTTAKKAPAKKAKEAEQGE